MDDEPVEVGDTTLIEPRRRGLGTWWLAVAAVVFLALWGWRELDIRRMREGEASDRAELRQLAAENRQLNQRLEHMLTAVASPNTKVIDLAGPRNTAAGSGKLFVDPAARRAIVVVSDLPPNGVSKDYQLWVTRSGARRPQSALVFDIPPSGAATLTIDNFADATDIKSVGITLETKGGADAPHGEYLLAGKP